MSKTSYPYPDVFFCPMGNDESITDTVDIRYKPEALIKAEEYFYSEENAFINLFQKNSEGKIMLEEISFWGTTLAMRSDWEKMKPEDLVFFSKNNKGFVYMGKILDTYEGEISREINKKFWSNNSIERNMTWDLIFILKDVRRISLTLVEMNIFPDYSERFIHRGLMRMNRQWGINFWESFPIYYMMNPNKFKRLDVE